MRRNHRPYRLEQWLNRLSHWYTEHFIRPQFDSLGCCPRVLAPRSLQVHGEAIHGGDYLHIISDPSKPVRITTWRMGASAGAIHLGHYVLIAPGVEITSAARIEIGDNCMIAAGCVIHDCDWHGLYNRLRPFRCSAPVSLGDNVWLGQHCRVGKGVSIGANSVIGAGSVVTSDIPANVVAAGNPARVVKTLNPRRRMLKREFLFRQGDRYWQQQEAISHYCQAQNTWRHWLRTLIAPRRTD